MVTPRPAVKRAFQPVVLGQSGSTDLVGLGALRAGCPESGVRAAVECLLATYSAFPDRRAIFNRCRQRSRVRKSLLRIRLTGSRRRSRSTRLRRFETVRNQVSPQVAKAGGNRIRDGSPCRPPGDLLLMNDPPGWRIEFVRASSALPTRPLPHRRGDRLLNREMRLENRLTRQLGRTSNAHRDFSGRHEAAVCPEIGEPRSCCRRATSMLR
jgi:hypothetical protein